MTNETRARLALLLRRLLRAEPEPANESYYRNYDALRDAVREYFDLLDHGDEQRFVEARKRLRGLAK